MQGVNQAYRSMIGCVCYDNIEMIVTHPRMPHNAKHYERFIAHKSNGRKIEGKELPRPIVGRE
jgi:hypothetical protein